MKNGGSFHSYVKLPEGTVWYGLWWSHPENVLKNDGLRQWVSDDIPYIYEMEKIFAMFETTNQYRSAYSHCWFIAY
jgi:hypothetical protein